MQPDEWQEHVLRGWLTLDSAGKWLAPRCGLAVPRQNGKNGVLEIRELYGLVVRGEKFLHTAHEVKTARKAFQRLLSFFDNEREFPELAGLVQEIRRTNGQEAIVLTNGGSVEFIARSRGSGRGFTVDVLVMDEAQELDEDANAALQPTISASPLGNPQKILTGTPPAPSMRGGVFMQMRTAGLAGEDLRLCWDEWSREPGCDLDDPGEWAMANPALGDRLQFAVAADERADMDDERFGRERCGIWYPTEFSSGLDFSNWPFMADPLSEIVGPKMYGLAVSPNHDWAALAVAGTRFDRVRHTDVGRHEYGTGWVIPAATELNQRQGPISLMVDGGGPAASLIPDLQSAGLDVHVVGARELAQSFGVFMDAVANKTLRHRNQAELNLAVSSARKRSVGDGASAFGRKASGEDITPLEAAALALLGHLDQQEHGFNVW